MGLAGFASGDWVDLTETSASMLTRLRMQPGAALGSSRHFLSDRELPAVLARCAERSTGAVYIIGGNGAMAAASKLAQAARAGGYAVHGQPLRVIGIPKTVDNDLAGVDVAPGYGSAARWVAQTVCDIGLDLRAMRSFDDVAVIEVMGRHAGWLAAAAALARHDPDDPPDLILVPEVIFDEERFLAKVQAIHRRKGICLVVASEGIKDAQGRFVAEKLGRSEADPSGQTLLGLAPGVAPYLAARVRGQLGLRCRHLRPDTIQRSSRALASEADRTLAEQVGRAAVKAAHRGESAIMVGLARQADGWETASIPLTSVVGKERRLPARYIGADEWWVTDAFIEYARPIVGDIGGAVVEF
ncbi:MAG: diphosphate--fructose-6-phosphate 1-phosphotransferase [Caldilineaceae bacterium]|nr:diphosphate--fructose-6-phosphate 1-phosphotransferase [Caldilineaceae bacterium]